MRTSRWFGEMFLFVPDANFYLPPFWFQNMLYACSILYKTKLPFIIAMNKTDVVDHKYAVEWMEDFETFQVSFILAASVVGRGGGSGVECLLFDLQTWVWFLSKKFIRFFHINFLLQLWATLDLDIGLFSISVISYSSCLVKMHLIPLYSECKF